MRRHPKFSYKILKEVNFSWDVKPIIYAHHERYDGKGYPAGLKEEKIQGAGFSSLCGQGNSQGLLLYIKV